MTCAEFSNRLCLHPDGDGLYYADFTADDRLYADTIASVAPITCDDDEVTVTDETVLGTSTVVPHQGGTRTIAANKGISFRVAGGTAQAEYDPPARLTILCTTAAGYIIAAVADVHIQS